MSGEVHTPPRGLRSGFVRILAVALFGCTYGPEEPSVRVTQVVRLGESYRALVVVRHDVQRRPTGLAAFPDGGAWKYTARGATVHLIDAEERSSRELARVGAPDDLWESFAAWVAGLEADSVAYVRLTGCPRDGQCHPALQRAAVYRLPILGGLEPIDDLPADVGLPGEMLARRPGEQHYVRFGTRRDTVTARLEDDGPFVSLFRADPDGSLVVVSR